MTSSILRSVRLTFVTLLLGLTVYTVLESVLGRGPTAVAHAAVDGLSACGSEAQPCLLEPIAAVAPAVASPRVQLASEGLTACGSKEQPCVMAPLKAEAVREDARLASTERAVGMTMRLRS